MEPGEIDDIMTTDFKLFAAGQFAWMAVTLVLLFVLGLWSPRLYFIVSFIGLLVNRLLFAPTEATPRWWKILNILTWVGFGVLSFIIYTRMQLNGV